MADLIRQEYSKILAADGDTSSLTKLAERPDTEPILTLRCIQPEEEPDFEAVNKNVVETLLDITDLDSRIIQAAQSFQDLRDTVDTRLASVQEQLETEKERLQDTNMICGKLTEFTAVKPLSFTVFSGDFGTSDDGRTFFCPTDEPNPVDYEILDISGNGYAGNKYVLPPTAANTEKADTSDSSYIQDNDQYTSFEYSRLETKVKDEAQPGKIFYDDEPVRCVITLYSSQESTELTINSPDTDLILEDVQVSNDNMNYSHAIREEIRFNNKEYSYNNYQYIYGSGYISYQPSNYVRLVFRSHTRTTDIIYDEDANDTPVLRNTRRKCVSLSGITLRNPSYTDMDMTSENAVQQGSIQAVAVFANVYIPLNFKKGSYIQMELIVNGTSYPVVPVNGNDVGIKIIRQKRDVPGTSGSYVQYVKEPITSAVLHVTMKSYNGIQSPYIGNLKFCVGKTGDIRV